MPPEPRFPRPSAVAPGFTLVELMVTVAVLAILLAIATPSFTSIINGNRLASGANELVASVQLARSEAVKRNRSVAICRSTDGANCVLAAGASWEGWITVVDATDEVLRMNTVKPPLEVSASDAIGDNTDRIVFRPDGMARTAAGVLLEAQFGVCIPTSLPAENQRLVSIVAGSRVSVDRNNAAGACPQPSDT